MTTRKLVILLVLFLTGIQIADALSCPPSGDMRIIYKNQLINGILMESSMTEGGELFCTLYVPSDVGMMLVHVTSGGNGRYYYTEDISRGMNFNTYNSVYKLCEALVNTGFQDTYGTISWSGSRSNIETTTIYNAVNADDCIRLLFPKDSDLNCYSCIAQNYHWDLTGWSCTGAIDFNWDSAISSSDYYCCGNDANEFYITENCPGASGKTACCNSASDKIDINGDCVSTCESDSNCDACTAAGYYWDISASKGVGCDGEHGSKDFEFLTVACKVGEPCRTQPCCGDDVNEYFRYLNGVDIGYWAADMEDDWINVLLAIGDGPHACCSSPDQCVAWPDSKCYSQGQYATGFAGDYIVLCGANSLWIDCDSSNEACGKCNLNWVSSGEASVGEYTQAGEIKCCGDDYYNYYGEGGYHEYYITTTCPGVSGKSACCNSASDKVDANGNCVTSCCTPITCSSYSGQCGAFSDGCGGTITCGEGLTTTSGCNQAGYCSGSYKTCSAGSWGSCSKSPQTESCNDAIDNDCDGESDYDSIDGRHGDNDCPVSVTAVSVSDSNPIENTNIDVYCTSSVAGVNSISAYIDSTLCAWNSWSGTIAKFSCNVGAYTGTLKTVKCTVDTLKSYQSGTDKTTQINIKTSTCSGYSSSTSCNADSRCNWCAQCSSTKYSGGNDRCISAGSCSYSCWKGQCGATCDNTNGGWTNYVCDNYCSGNTLYPRADVTNYCMDDCTPTANTCSTGTPMSCGISSCTAQHTTGSCNNPCNEAGTPTDNTDATCGACTPACSCESGYVDLNSNMADGCECQISTEICDNLDNDCDGQVDEGLTTTYYRDADGDGYGTPSSTTQACTIPSGYAANNQDCNDNNAAIKPGATEICDSSDNDCDSSIDENPSPSTPLCGIKTCPSDGCYDTDSNSVADTYSDYIDSCSKTCSGTCQDCSCSYTTPTKSQDNDNDGIENRCDTEADELGCKDSLDNDGDAKIDYSDSGCTDFCTSCELCGEGFFDVCTQSECGNCGTNCKFALPFSCCIDSDYDNICNTDDNCQDISNSNQLDTDNDGTGDACELCDSEPSLTTPSETPEQTCNDNIDNDCDSLIDISDNDCRCPEGTTLCADGICRENCDDVDCDNDNFCDDSEGCACPDCDELQDNCETGLICDYSSASCVGPPPCPEGTTLCADSYCRENCGTDPGPDDGDTECDAGEGCNVAACDSLQDSCENWLICDYSSKQCTDGPPCREGTTLCADGICRGTCDTPSGCNSDSVCDITESCGCADCNNLQDSCEAGLVCDYNAGICTDGPPCPKGTALCEDGSCKSDCTNNGGDASCLTEGESGTAACDPGEGCSCDDCDTMQDSCENGLFCDYTTGLCSDEDDLSSTLCEATAPGIQGICDAHGERYCWSPSPSIRALGRCCGDDEEETWDYSTQYYLEDVLVRGTCYKGEWYERESGGIIYYGILPTE